MIPPFDRYPFTDGLIRHPERPWWVAELGPVLPSDPPVQIGRWRREYDGHIAESDRGYNALPEPDDGILQIRECDATDPLAMPPLRCGQVWRTDIANTDFTLLAVQTHAGSVSARAIRGMRVSALQPSDLRNAVLLSGPSAPWASAAWVARNCPSDGPVWGL